MKNKRFHTIIIILLLAVLTFFLLNKSNTSQVCFQTTCLDVEIVETEEERTRGLMFRESLGTNEGMFFIFPSSEIYPFWMKNTLIPLDIIWIDEDFKIVHIEQAVPCVEDPCPNYTPGEKAKYVLETNVGFTQEHKINTGDVARFLR